MIPWFEVCANVVNAASIVLAARNNVQTWWTGMLGCALFAVLFYNARLYADVMLQGFFIITNAYGWWQWERGNHGTELPVTRVRLRFFAWSVLGAVLVAVGYGYLLSRFTNAFAPFIDSLVLAFSVLAQLLMMRRLYESWWLWLVVNTLSVALFGIKGLWVTTVLYSAFWVNAVVALFTWRRLIGRPVAS